MVSEKFRRSALEFAFLDADFFFFLRLASPVALFLHQLLKSGYVDREPALARHQLREIQRKTVSVVKFEREFAGDYACKGERGRLARHVTRLAGHRRGRWRPHPRIVLIRLGRAWIPPTSPEQTKTPLQSPF